MSHRKLGTITIGQAPRPDITPILDACIDAAVPRVHVGLLDGLDRDRIAARFAPVAGQPVLITRLLDGSSVTVDKRAAEAAAQAKMRELEAQGCTTILILCTGEFSHLAAERAWLIEPDRILAPAVAALTQDRQVGILVPLPEQIESEAAKWRTLSRTPICAAASPYSDDDKALARAARELRDRGADVLLTDCIGFVERHRQVAAEASGLPVILSNALIAKLTAEVL